MSIIQVEHVSHHFGTLRVLDDVSFEVRAGEVSGFIGPNGAGKTTTLRMMATLLEPDRGRVRVCGYDVVDEPSRVRRFLGFMPDYYGVYDRITVGEYLDFFASAYGLEFGARRRTVEAVIALTELGDLRERLVSALSKGMTQRLAIARTLLHDPQVLLLDEPANGLDPRARIEMRDLIFQLRDLGKTVLLSSHILTELSDMVTSVVILEKGRVKAAGPIGDIGRSLRADHCMRMRLLRPVTEVPEVLRRAPGVTTAELAPDGALRLAFVGGDARVAEIVRIAVDAGLDVIRVEPEREDLERIFLHVTKGELQ
ncbi:MAG: ABC transporter ATP-binding protein [Myxococcales bacterium]|nr:ABC transporter ATP-binding protein [Myxococcales bacterium]